MFCVVLFHRAHNVVFFFLGKKKMNFKHLITSSVDVGANSEGEELAMVRNWQLPGHQWHRKRMTSCIVSLFRQKYGNK